MRDTLVVGFGGAGSYIAEYAQGLLGCDALAINTDASALRKSSFVSKLLIGPGACKGAPAGVPQHGLLAAEESIVELEHALAGYVTVVLVAGFGGGTGTGAVPVVVRLARSLGKNLIVAATLPFGFEDTRRKVALDALSDLQSEGVEVLVFDNQALLEDGSNHSTPLPDLFARSARKISESVRARLAVVT
ncbi:MULTISPECIES: hypothetical protein [unclassified Marinobacter]|uniref:hypothetical protein n=1 Tax=unclassified Marinobacter TaxID=83889 RepID=UPI00069D0CC7|nr:MULTISPECIES: hypothetical protein [unclassified Marinobacter]